MLAGLRTARPLPALVAGAVLVLAAAGASTSAALAKDGVLAWERWDPNGTSRQVSVSYVWDANYGGIEFPKEKTTVLRIRGPQRGLYWRATTLDQFTADRWLENPTPLSTGLARGRLPSDPLLPARSLNPRTWVKQQVEVVALRDAHIVAATQPVALRGAAARRCLQPLRRDRPRLRRAQARAALHGLQLRAASRACPARPRRARPTRAALDRFLQIGRTRVEPFGAAGRDARVDALFDDERYLALWPYEELWNEAQRLRAGARTPYGAVVAIETWLRDDRRLRLRRDAARRPAACRRSRTSSPRASAATASTSPARWRSCSASSGSPRASPRASRAASERTAAGPSPTTTRTPGSRSGSRSYGWLAFDPTPGRGALAAAYSVSSSGFNPGDAADAFGPRRGGANSGGAGELDRLPAEGAARGAAAGRPGRAETAAACGRSGSCSRSCSSPAARSAQPSSSGGASAT